MRKPLAAAAAALFLSGAAPAPEASPARGPRLPGFARALAAQPAIAGPDAWAVTGRSEAWRGIARSSLDTRQAARWKLARSLIGGGLAAEALGVLDTMAADDPDLALVGSFRLARAAALAQLRRSSEALDMLADPALARNPEACAWRMLALTQAGADEQALGQLDCAGPALASRKPAQRSPFILAAARSAVAAGNPALAIDRLRFAPSGAARDLLKGRVLLALGKTGEGEKLLARVERTGSPEQRLDAELARIENRVARKSMPTRQALKALEHIRYAWRGGDVEERALRLSYRLNADVGNLRGALSAGHALLRYFDLGADGPAFAAELQGQLASALDPENPMPLDQAIGLYWDYRDLAPLGAEGDLLVVRLAERLQAEGLYARAADLLEHQLFERAKDLAQGPLSTRVASLHILAGHPDRALEAIRKSSGPAYPPTMQWDRRRVEAVALTQLGKAAEAMAALQDVPGGDALIAEILWKRRDWAAFASATAPALPRGRGMSEIEQAIVLRHAVALAMMGREDRLAALRTRYAPAFAGLPTESAFDLLTGDIAAVDIEMLSEAMAAIPSASPAGPLADLLERAPA